VRDNGVGHSRAVLITLGTGRRHVLSVESASSWKDHLVRLKERGLHGVRLAASDDHAGLKRAIMETLPEAHWQRCYVHFLRNALDYLPRKQTDDCLTELRWLYDRHTAEEARRDLGQWLTRWRDKQPKLCAWVEANIDETFAFYRLPREHHKHLNQRICSNASTRKSNAARCSSASSATSRAACGWCARSPSRSTRNGSMRTATST
jgi:putative transposase